MDPATLALLEELRAALARGCQCDGFDASRLRERIDAALALAAMTPDERRVYYLDRGGLEEERAEATYARDFPEEY